MTPLKRKAGTSPLDRVERQKQYQINRNAARKIKQNGDCIFKPWNPPQHAVQRPPTPPLTPPQQGGAMQTEPLSAISTAQDCATSLDVYPASPSSVLDVSRHEPSPGPDYILDVGILELSSSPSPMLDASISGSVGDEASLPLLDDQPELRASSLVGEPYELLVPSPDQDEAVGELLDAQENAIQVLNTMFSTLSCNSATCDHEEVPDAEGHYTLDEISQCIEANILVTDRSLHNHLPRRAPRGFPLSHPTVQSAPSSTLRLSEDINWTKLLTGHGAFGTHPDPPILSLAKTERASTALSRLHHGQASLGVSYDIDSITFEARSLAVHRGAFKIFLAPNFLQSIRHNQKITIEGLGTPLHQTKHIALGYGNYSSGINFTTYMVFPHYPAMKMRGESKIVSHLDKKSLARLYDAAIFTAIKQQCDTHITQHIPVSFQDAYTKAHANAEIGRGGGNSTGIGLTAPIPQERLEAIWSTIVLHCATLQGPHETQGFVFRNPILLVQAHDTKLSLARSATLQGTYDKFGANMNRMFYMDPARYINPANFWVDLAREVISQEDGCTAIGKRACLEHRVRRGLQQPKQQPNAVTQYPMAGLWEAGALTVKMHQQSALFAGGIVDVKAYNVNKEQLAVPVKNHSPFSNCSLEGLGLTEDRLSAWYQAGTGRKIPEQDQGTLKRLIGILESTKKRLWAAYTDSSSSSYGVREEYRITYPLFQAYVRQLRPDVRQPELPTRLPFWVVDTQSLNRFRIADTNRWLSCLESIIEATTSFRIGKKECLSLTMDPDQHSPLASAMCRILHASLGCHASDRSIWQGVSQRRKRTQRAQPPPPLKEGLQMKAISKAYGMMWFPRTNIAGKRLLEDRVSPPRVQPSLRHTLAIGDTGLVHLFKKKNITLDCTSRLNTQLATLSSLIETAVQDNRLSSYQDRVAMYNTAAQVCIQEYQQWMWGILQQRFEQHTKVKATNADVDVRASDFYDFVLEHSGSKELIDGLVSVGYGQIQGVFQTIADIRLVPVQAVTRASKFKTHQLYTWKERIRTLFFPEEGQFPRATLPFVTLARKLGEMIANVLREHNIQHGNQEIGEGEWRELLCTNASCRMFAILQYDFFTPAVLQKQPKDRARLTELERTGLYGAAANPAIYNAQPHNTLLQKKATQQVLYKTCDEPPHLQFLEHVYRHQGGLPVYMKRSKHGRYTLPPLGERDVLFAHGRTLTKAVAFEQLGLLVCRGEAVESSEGEDSNGEGSDVDGEDEDW